MALVLGTPGDDVLFGVLAPNPGDNEDDLIIGFAGNDRLTGLNGDDILDGGEGNDILNGSAGDDLVQGGDGIDGVHGNEGDDALFGNKGDDNITGGAGDDVIVWTNGDGSDTIDGGSADIEDRQEVNGSLDLGDQFELVDSGFGEALFSRSNLGLFTLTMTDIEKVRVFGHGGEDELIVGDLSGTDVGIVNFFGGDGDDVMDGSAATTRITYTGEAGDDTGVGGSANDFLRGRDGTDDLSGGDGDDRLVGDKGDDILNGGDGNDLFVWSNGDGSDDVDGGDGVDTQRFNLANGPGDETLLESSGGDALFSRLNLGLFTVTMDAVERVTMQGAGGDDTLVIDNVEDASDVTVVNFAGNFGQDTLMTTAGTTVRIIANGGEGDDVLHGGHGDDALVGSTGQDMLVGRGGVDRLLGQDGDDMMFGGGGADVFVFRSGDDHDTIGDYQGHDLIRFNDVAFGFGDLLIGDSGGDLRIETPDGDTITLLGEAGRVLDAGDFLFA